MIIKVTQEHIDKGIQGKSHVCPVALALREATGLNASVYNDIFLWKDPDSGEHEYIAETPTPVLQEIKTFDHHGEMTPFTFEIDYDPTIQYKMDGNQWSATFEDFINLQESPAGFGETKVEALAHLRSQ